MAIVIPSQDCLKSHMKTLDPYPRKKLPTTTRSSGRRKRSPVHTTGRCRAPAASPPDVVLRSRAKDLVMGQVKILKRGEEDVPMTKVLESPKKDQRSPIKDLRIDDDFVASSSVMGPEPEMVPKHRIGASAKDAGLDSFEDDFAGSTFITSPSPNSVPLPGFFFRKKDDAATKDLLRILRLDDLAS